MKEYIREPSYSNLRKTLSGKQNFIQVIVGPRQVGKTTLALQLFRNWNGPKLYESADLLNTPDTIWIKTQWEKIRESKKNEKDKSLLILDEIQKIPHWSEVVKLLFDEDQRFKKNIRLILLGSAALLIQKGLTESLAGRFEIHRLNQWSFKECNEFFKINLNKYLFFGGYPSALPLRKNEERWAAYIRDSLIETVVSKDILLLAPITKPILLRQSLSLALSYPAQILSYQKMLGTLHEAGNTTTIASYLQLLSKAFLLGLLERWGGGRIKQKGSTPKILVLDNGLISAVSGQRFKPSIKDKTNWGRLIENAVGAQLYCLSQSIGGELFYWKERDLEVDFVLKVGKNVLSIEVKSGIPNKTRRALDIFNKRFSNSNCVIISNSREKCIGDKRNIQFKDFFIKPQLILDQL